MTWILTAITGALLSGVTILLLALVLRYPRKPVQIGAWEWNSLLGGWFKRTLPLQVAKWIQVMRPAEQIQAHLNQASTKEQVDVWLNKQVNNYLVNAVPVKWPMISMLIGDKTQDKIKQALSDHLAENWESMTDDLCKNQLSNEQIIRAISSKLTQPQQAQLAAFAWQEIKCQLLRLTPLLLLVGALLAVVGRLLYQTISSF